MVEYSNRRLGDIYQEIVIRAGRLRIAENMDYKSIVNCINGAIRDIASKYIPFKEWANRYNIYVIDQQLIPRNFIKPVRVMLSVTGNPPYNEARRVDIREFYNLMSWEKRNTWNGCSQLNPLYTLWGYPELANRTTRMRIMLAPNRRYQIGPTPPRYEYDSADVSGYMEYYGMPYPLTDDGDRVQLPYEFEDMTVNVALMKIYYRLGMSDMMAQMFELVEADKKRIEQKYQEMMITRGQELTSFLEPAQPYAPPEPVPGEVSSRL